MTFYITKHTVARQGERDRQREGEREGERRDRGRGGWRSSIRRCLRTNLFRQGVCAWAGMGEGLFLVCTSLFALRRMHPSVSHIHARCTHGVLGLLACCLFIRLSLFFCVCVHPCLADGRTVGITRYRLLVLVYYPTALFHLLLLLLNIK